MQAAKHSWTELIAHRSDVPAQHPSHIGLLSHLPFDSQHNEYSDDGHGLAGGQRLPKKRAI